MEQRKDDILLETGTNELEIAEFGIRVKGKDKIQSFGINVAKIREIIKTPSFIHIPKSHNDVTGVFKLRDKIIPLIDLARWLNEETENIKIEECFVIVTEFNQNNFGFLVHDIRTIHRMSWKKILSPSTVNTKTSAKGDCITGIVNFDDRIMMMIDFEKIVADINPQLGMGQDIEQTIKEVTEKAPKDKKYRVLIAEDSSLIRDMVRDILTKGGFEVIETKNGQEAYEYIQKITEKAKSENKRINEYLQLLITDIEMPQMDGHSLCKKVKENSETSTLPVALYSSLIYEEMRRKGERIGADAQISKPELANVVTIASDLIEKSQEKLRKA